MISAKSFTLVALVALTASSVSARQLLQSGSCPLPADAVANVDLSGLAQPCGSNSTLCTECLCLLVGNLVPAYVAGGVTFDPENPTSFDVAKVSEISQACATALAPQLASALGDNAATLAGLPECPLIADSLAGNVTANSLPSCLTVEALTAAFASANTSMANMTANSTMNSTTELDTDMTMEEDNSTMTDSSSTPNATASQGPAASSPPAASPAASPAPRASSGAVAGMTALATVGAAALAALLL